MLLWALTMSEAPIIPNEAEQPSLKPTDLRGILRYVPMFQGQIFIIAIDGHVVADEKFANVLLDIAVLRSLGIRVVLVFGIARQLDLMAEARGVTLSNRRGDGPVDDPTLELAIEASARVGQRFLEGLTHSNIAVAASNAIRATAVGVLKGVDYMHTGKVDRIQRRLVMDLLEREVVPLVPPIAAGRDGQSYRLNSDHLAAELAIGLGASKLIFLTPFAGLCVDGAQQLNLPVEELSLVLERRPETIDEAVLSKAREVVRALRAETPRAHFIDGRIFGALLREVFDKVGIGTMIHANDYQQIRRARKKDAQGIYDITRNAVKSASLRQRSKQEIEASIDRFYVYEIDGSIVGCAQLIQYPEASAVEIAAVLVQPFYQNRGVGRKLIDYLCIEGQRQGFARAFCLTTQSLAFFRDVCGFQEISPGELPESRRLSYEKEGRHSRVLEKELN